MPYTRALPGRRRNVAFEKRSSTGPSAPSAPAALRVALLGTGAAARCAWAAVHDAGHTIVAVGGRDAADAAAFINARGGRVAGSPSTTTTTTTTATTTTTTTAATAVVVRACGYDEAVNTRDVDVLHITLPPAEREQWIGKCIRLRKHMFLSSPAAPSVAALQRWVEAVTPLRLLLVDSAALAYSGRLTQLRACFGPETLVGPMRGIRLSCAAGAVENNENSNKDHNNNNNNNNNSSGKREDVREKESDVFGEMLWRAVAALLQVAGEKAPAALMARALHRRDQSNDSITEIAAEMIFREKQPASPLAVFPSDVVTAALYVSRAGPAEQCLTAYGSGGSVTLHDALAPLPLAEGFLRIATEDKVESPTHRGRSSRRVRCEREEPVKEAAEDRSVGLPWRRFRAALAANPQAAGSPYAPRFRGDTEEGITAMRRMWETQLIVDGLMNAVRKTSEAES